jgi:hypothetical protein
MPSEIDHTKLIQQALSVAGGHLFIGRGGYSLHYADGSKLSGYDSLSIKAKCLAAGLTIIDSTTAELNMVYSVLRGPTVVAVGSAPDAEPYNSLSKIPLDFVVNAWRSAGAKIYNHPQPSPAQEIK